MSSPIVAHRHDAFLKQGGRCYYCGALMWLNESDKDGFAINHSLSKREAAKFMCTAEHLLARCDGGDNSKNIIVAACIFCTRGRHKRKQPAAPNKYKELIQSD